MDQHANRTLCIAFHFGAVCSLAQSDSNGVGSKTVHLSRFWMLHWKRVTAVNVINNNYIVNVNVNIILPGRNANNVELHISTTESFIIAENWNYALGEPTERMNELKDTKEQQQKKKKNKKSPCHSSLILLSFHENQLLISMIIPFLFFLFFFSVPLCVLLFGSMHQICRRDYLIAFYNLVWQKRGEQKITNKLKLNW